MHVSPIKSFKSPRPLGSVQTPALEAGPLSPELGEVPPCTELPSLGSTCYSKCFRVFLAAAPRLPSLPCGFHGPHSTRSRHEAGPGKFQLPPPPNLSNPGEAEAPGGQSPDQHLPGTLGPTGLCAAGLAG